MAHQIFEKTSTGWKKVKKSWLKGDPDWIKIKKGWVKTTPLDWKLFFGGGFPKGIILPFNSSGAVPTGWAEYTEAYDNVNVSMKNNSGVWVNVPINRSVIGADVAKAPTAVGGTATVTHTGKVSNSGTHGGNPYPWNAAFNGDGDCLTCIQYDGDAHHGYNRGGHVHSNITETVRVDPRKAGMRFVKATTNAGELPSRVSIMSVVDLPPIMTSENGDSPADLNEVGNSSTYSGKYLTGDPVTGNLDGNTTNLSRNVTTSYAGSHAHGGVNRTLFTANTGTYAVNAGNHRHTGYVKATTNYYTHTYMSVWYSASDVIESSSSMIGMWEGITPPPGWVMCNGANGTPDLRNRFIRYGNSGNRGTRGGSMQVGLGTHTDTNGGHDHIPSSPNSNNQNQRLDIKHYYTVGHAHSSTDSYKALTPPYYSLSFIMKLPE